MIWSRCGIGSAACLDGQGPADVDSVLEMIGGVGGVFLGPVLQTAPFLRGQRTDHFRRGTEHHGSGGDAGALGDQGVCPDDALLADLGAVEDGGAHADEAFVPDGAGVDDGGMADGDVAANDRAEVVGQVNHGVVLDVRVIADDDAVDVTPQHGSVPDARVIAEGDVADHRGAAGDEDPLAEPRGLAQELVQLAAQVIHEADSRRDRPVANEKPAPGGRGWAGFGRMFNLTGRLPADGDADADAGATGVVRMTVVRRADVDWAAADGGRRGEHGGRAVVGDGWGDPDRGRAHDDRGWLDHIDRRRRGVDDHRSRADDDRRRGRGRRRAAVDHSGLGGAGDGRSGGGADDQTAERPPGGVLVSGSRRVGQGEGAGDQSCCEFGIHNILDSLRGLRRRAIWFIQGAAEGTRGAEAGRGPRAACP